MSTPDNTKPWLPLGNTAKLVVIVIFSFVAVSLNFWRVPLFFGVDFIFGSIVAIMALSLLGSRAALVVGACAAAVTIWLWEHYYAWLLFTAEIVWLSWRWRSSKNFNLVLQDLVFWFVIALPYNLFVFTQLLHTDLAAAVLIWIKVLVNGVFNTLLASIGLLLLQMHKGISLSLALPKVKLQQLLFHTLMFLTLAAGAVPFLIDARKLETVYQKQLEQRLELATELLRGRINQSDEAVSAKGVSQAIVSEITAATGFTVLLRDAAGNLINQSTGLSPMPEPPRFPVETGFYQIRPENKGIRVNLWLHSWYALVTLIPLNDTEISLAVAVPGRELANQLKKDSTEQLLLLVAFILITIGVSWWLSRRLVKPLSQLAGDSRNMLADIATGEQRGFLAEQVTEYHDLADGLSRLHAELMQRFSDNEQTRLALAQQIKQRTAELEQSNSQLEAILSAATNFSIIATDLQGTIRYFSPGAERLLGYAAAELVGQYTPAVIHLAAEVATRSAQLTTELQRPITGFATFITLATLDGSETREWHYVTKTNQLIPVALTVTCIKNNNGQVTGYLGVAKDISERQRIERLKNEFISTVSHELRTPLTSIHGALKLLSSGKLLVLPAKIDTLVRIASNNSERLTALIDDLLDMEKLLAGKLVLELLPYQLQPIICETLDSMAEYANTFQVTLVKDLVDQPVYCQLDQQRFIQVLTNLISNAVKFSHAEAEVRIKLYQHDDAVYIEVKDQGVGIAEDFKARVFERFAQSDAASTRKQGGTGLGLAISKELVLQMGGLIGFNSELGVGTTFWLRFPKHSLKPVTDESMFDLT